MISTSFSSDRTFVGAIEHYDNNKIQINGIDRFTEKVEFIELPFVRGDF